MSDADFAGRATSKYDSVKNCKIRAPHKNSRNKAGMSMKTNDDTKSPQGERAPVRDFGAFLGAVGVEGFLALGVVEMGHSSKASA